VKHKFQRTGLRYGRQRFASADIPRSHLEGLANFVWFPCVNADGRHYDSQYGVDGWKWRKNRRIPANGFRP
jgi:hypothetical protein